MMDVLSSISSGLVLFGAHVYFFVCLCGMIFTCREAVIEHNLLFLHFVVMLCFLQKNFSDVDKFISNLHHTQGRDASLPESYVG